MSKHEVNVEYIQYVSQSVFFSTHQCVLTIEGRKTPSVLLAILAAVVRLSSESGTSRPSVKESPIVQIFIFFLSPKVIMCGRLGGLVPR